jgi:hypothetical protein
MSVTGTVAIALAERVERRGGPRAGLVAWKALASKSSDPSVRGEALVAALRCALALRDRDAIGELTRLWETVNRGVWEDGIAELCKQMVRAQLLSEAVALAGAEARRHRTARSLYLYARCLDVACDPAAEAAFREVVQRALKEGADDVAAAARARRSVLLARSWMTVAEALEEARQVDLTKVSPQARLAVARVSLLSPSRFVRAAAIGALDELACGDDPALAARALSAAARFVDDAAETLTPLELDRLAALFGRERVVKVAPRALPVLRAIERIARANDADLEPALTEAANVEPSIEPILARARDIVRGRFEPTREVADEPPLAAEARRAFRYEQILDVAVAMRDRAPARAARALRALAEAEEAGDRAPRELLAVAWSALVGEDAELRDVAARWFEARLSRPAPGSPPGGLLVLADVLAALGRERASELARRAAVVTKEPGSAEALGTLLARAGWEHARSGARERAIAELREAKSLLECGQRRAG